MDLYQNCSKEELLKIIGKLQKENEVLSAQVRKNEDFFSSSADKDMRRFKEKYAVAILDSLPDMLTVLSHSGKLIELVSSEETNHVGESSDQLIGRDISTILPKEAYKNIKTNLDRVVETNSGSIAHHTLTVNEETRQYENRIFPLDSQHVLCMCRDVTEAERYKKELELANRRMKLAENIASLSYWYYFSETKEFEAPGIVPLLFKGCDRQVRCTGKEYLSYVHPDDVEKLKAYFTCPRLSDDYLEHRLIVEGKTCYLHTRIIQIRRKDGSTVIEGYVQDMTYMVERIHELETVKYAVNRALEEIYSCSLEGTLEFANQQFMSRHSLSGPVSGYKVYELEGKKLTPEEWQERIDRMRNQGGTGKHTEKYLLPGGGAETLEVSTYIIRDSSGREVIWSFGRDITQRVNHETKIRELNYVMDAILNNIPVYLFVKDPGNEFRYLYWNKAFEEHSGIPASCVLGKTDFEIFPDRRDAEKFRADDLRLLNEQEKIEFQEKYVTARGDVRIVNTCKALVPSENKMPLIIGVSWDITDLKNTEKELIAARLKAEQSDTLKTAFLANMSHEIRTPLNAIVGFSKLVASAADEEEKQQYSDIIDSNSELLLQLINDILDISKIEAGTLEFIDKTFNLNEICRDIYEVHKSRVKPGVTLIFENNHADLLWVGDQNRLVQVITNLITNAIKFTSQGEIRFGFCLQKREKRIEFYVKDTGTGISKEHMEKIFDRFIKLNNFVQGTGLGLAISKMIIEKMGGSIGVESEEQVGSTFWFTIPYSEENDMTDMQAKENIAASNPINRPTDQKKVILVAEDIESNYLLLKAFIGKRYTLVHAHDGREAVELYKTSCPDLILMDIKMPEMNGLEATRLIRQLSADIPIIALTAFAFDSDKQEAFAAGCNDFITKPISLSVLTQTINRYIGEEGNS